ncbi:50S ribosomal protein L4 [Patescibacteria group bacterium]|nr:50S ribosomal protein L4 [Patescibacteria group bacterium]MBU1890332.1 50S ribosomal protein L4 [Patescibacteria group bacterium]
MIKVKVIDQAGKEVGEEKLDPKIFEVPIKQDLVHQAVVAQQANTRQVIAHTKDRSEVRGGGRKPWRQKGTGRARHGSSRSPIWIGGGITFGPRNDRNFSKGINKKVKRQALLMGLSDRAKNGKITILDKLELTSPKTKAIAELLKNAKFNTGSLIVIAKKNDAIKQSVRNIKKVNLLPANSLNILSILKHPRLLITKDSLAVLKKTYLAE